MPTVVRIRGWGFALVNLPVVLVYGYGRGSCHLDFCRDVGFPDRLRVRGLGLRPFVVYTCVPDDGFVVYTCVPDDGS